LKIRTSVAAVGAAALVGTGAFVLPALASPHSTTHTLKFISVEKKSAGLTKTEFAQQDTDVNSKGKTVGFDELYVKATSATSGKGNVTVDTKGGMLYGTFNVNLNSGAVTHAKVTGGTGAFKGATGTFTAKNISSTRTAVTIKYHT
jgi:hypothetical protein